MVTTHKYVRVADLSITQYVDISTLENWNAKLSIRVCRAALAYGFNSVVVPSFYAETVRNEFPSLRLTIPCNYLGLHAAEVVLREIEAITSLVEDQSNLWVEFVIPPYFRHYIREFRKLNMGWVKLIGILPITTPKVSSLDEMVSLIKENPGVFDYVGFGVDEKTRGQAFIAYQKYGTTLKNVGFKLKLNGSYSNHEEVQALVGQGVDLVGCVKAHNVIKERVEL